MPRRAKPAGSGGRTDTLTQPNRVPVGLPYGQNQRLAAAQKALPLPASAPPPTPSPPPASPPPGAGGGGAPAPAAPPQAPDALGAATAMPYNEVGLGAPSNRPHEHITTGLPNGPGVPIQLPGAGANVSGLLDQIASASGMPELSALAQRAKALNQ